MNAKNQNLSLSNLGDMQVLADDIKKFIQQNKLSTNVQGKEFPQAEAWQYAGNRLGIIPQARYVKNKSTDTEIKYEASIVLIDINNDFKQVGQGFAVCSNKEQGKKFYQEFAICSMAQTRAIGKSYRIMLSFLMRLAGYEPTPAEEMDYSGNTTEVKVEQPSPSPLKEQPAESVPVSAKFVPAPKYASAKQKEEIIRLLNNPVITRQEKTKMLLNINKLDEERANQAISKLKRIVEERANQTA